MAEATRIAQTMNSFRDEEYRTIYAVDHMNIGLAFQIRQMREARGWTQAELADRLGTKQSNVSHLEDPDYQRYSIATLQRLAHVFDVALDVRFRSFSHIAEGADIAIPASFEEECPA